MSQESMKYIPCLSCGSLNRIPLTKIAQPSEKAPTCGKCNTDLHIEKSALDVSDDVAQKTIASSPIPVLVDFWAPWCGPCKMFGPTYEKYAGQNPSTAVYLKINTDENTVLASEHGIRSIPTVILFIGGKVKSIRPGVMSANDISSWLKENEVSMS